MMHASVLRLLSLIIICFSSLEAVIDYLLHPERKDCYNCICQADTTCDDIYVCAEKTISYDYWEQAGAPSLKVEGNPDLSKQYKECMKNETCILNTIGIYTDNIITKIYDIDCDGQIDCRDYFAAHKFGMDAKKLKLGLAFRMRFDRCDGHGGGNLTNSGWDARICVQPK